MEKDKLIVEKIAKNVIDYSEGIDIASLKFKDLVKNKDKFIIIINMIDSHKILKKYIKKLMIYERLLLKNFNEVKIYLIDYDEEKIIFKQFYELIFPIFSGSKELVCSKAYDLACDYLDSFFYGKNLCDFHNNKCGYKKDYDIEVGCCRHFEKHKRFGLFFGEKLVHCEKLGVDGHCTIRCLCCKLMTCDYLNKKGIRFKQKDIFPIDCVFNWRQKVYIKCMAYASKEEVMKGIMFLS